MKHRGLLLLVFFCLSSALAPCASNAGDVYFEGEGMITPSEKSQTPFDAQRLLFSPPDTDRSATAVGDQVVVNALAVNFPDILLYVNVADSGGNSISGLGQTAFSLAEQANGETAAVAETITRFSETATGSTGISFALVFDVSGSMGTGTRLPDAKSAAIDFINNCSANDRVALIKFSSNTNVEIVMASNWVGTDSNSNGTPDVVEEINALVDGGVTALYDGTAKGIESLSQEPSPKAVIVFTDGSSNDDVLHDINSVVSMANNNGVPLYTIGLELDPQNLKDMASATGGAYYYAPSAQDMTAIYASIAQGMQSQYEIAYTSHNPMFDGSTRTVTVSVGGVSGSAVYVVNYKPQIALGSATVLLSSQSQQPSTALTISGTVVDIDAQSQGQSLAAQLHYRPVGTGTYTVVDLTLSSLGNGQYGFSGIIPAAAVQEPGLQYYLRATDGLLETFSPFNYATLPYSISVLQNHAPNIVHTPVTSAGVNQPVSISADVTDPDSGDSVSDVILYYRVHNPNQVTPYFSVPMSLSGGTTYTAVIPADKMTVDGVDYFISAADNHSVRADKGSAVNPYQISASTGNVQINLVNPPDCSPTLTFSATIQLQ